MTHCTNLIGGRLSWINHMHNFSSDGGFRKFKIPQNHRLLNMVDFRFETVKKRESSRKTIFT